jgi:uncharacterized membrane protein YeaQ/YmgE (transglycosylase-associated protein family)
MGILSWIIVGLVSGVIAKSLMPGSGNEPSGWVGTIGLGIVGALVGGFLSNLFLGSGGVSGFNLGSIVVSVIGACVLIAGLRFFQGRR